MRALISFYLLFKSATRQKLTWFDIGLAMVLGAKGDDGLLVISSKLLPEWARMIANMKQEAPLPEAFVDWRWGLEGSIRATVRRWRGRS